MFKCVGCAEHSKTQDAHLVPLVDALEPLETKSKTKTISLMILFHVCVSVLCVCMESVCVCV